MARATITMFLKDRADGSVNVKAGGDLVINVEYDRATMETPKSVAQDLADLVVATIEKKVDESYANFQDAVKPASKKTKTKQCPDDLSNRED